MISLNFDTVCIYQDVMENIFPFHKGVGGSQKCLKALINSSKHNVVMLLRLDK